MYPIEKLFYGVDSNAKQLSNQNKKREAAVVMPFTELLDYDQWLWSSKQLAGRSRKRTHSGCHPTFYEL